MRYPKFLQKGGTIGFVAPSFGAATEPYQSLFDNALKKWKALGYKPDIGPNCYSCDGTGISSTPAKCGQELTQYYISEENDCVISCGGGELMCEVLDYVDFDAIKASDPKMFMGFSDNTNFTYLLATLCDTASVYGPCAPTFGMEPWHQSLKDAMNLLTGKSLSVHGYPKWEKAKDERGEEDPLAPYHVTQPRRIYCYDTSLTCGRKNPDVHFKGRLLGGCMDCLVNLLGTNYDYTSNFLEKYKDDGIIWFLEACDLNVFGIRRAMWQMEHAGWFKYTRGFLFGRPLNGEEMMGLDEYQAFLEVAGKKNVPVVMDVDLGHLPPMMPLIVGSMADVTLNGNQIRIDMKGI